MPNSVYLRTTPLRRLFKAGSILLAAVLCGKVVMAGSLDPAVIDQPQLPAVPDFISARRPIPDDLLSQKVIGSYWIAFPIIGYNPDTLFNIGATLVFFENGPKDSPFFRFNPYVSKTAVAVAYATGGQTQLRFNYDAPNFRDSPWHVHFGALYLKNDFEDYFGVGPSTLGPLTFPGSNQTFQTYNSFRDALREIRDGRTYANYVNYRQQQILADFTLERDMMGGILRPLVGLQVGYYKIGDLSGTDFEGAVNQTTKLRSDYIAGRIRGFDGGWDNAIKLGLTYDTRDFAPNPSTGVFAQIIGRGSLRALGSSQTYGQVKVEARGFYSPFPKPTRFVLAGRIGYFGQTSATPFYMLSQAPGVDSSSTWLGGFDSLRGFQNNRFIGNNVFVANAAVRWFWAETRFLNQNLAFGNSLFVDSGTILGRRPDNISSSYKVGGGVGFLLSWNVSTVVNFDLGKSREGTLFYMGLGLPY